MNYVIQLLDKLDKFFFKIYQLIKNNFFLIVNDYLPFLNLKFLSSNFSKLIQIINKWISSNFPSFHELIVRIFLWYKTHKSLILRYLRFYIYSCFIFYISSWLILTTSLYTGSETLFIIAKFLLFFYRYWTYPIKRVKFLIPYILSIPYKILYNFFLIISSLWRLLKDILNFGRKGPGKAESAGKGDKNYEKQLKDFSTDPTAWAINCQNNRMGKLMVSIQSYKKLKAAGNFASELLDNNEDPRRAFKWFADNFREDIEKVNIKYPCPTSYEFMKKKREE